MFKKDRDLAERSKTLLKNKEVRSLKAEILKQFSLTEEALNTLIPNKADITQTKLASRTILYSLNNTPLLFDLQGRNDLHPALPFLWAFPDSLPCLVVHSMVSQYVLRGADVMGPGLVLHSMVSQYVLRGADVMGPGLVLHSMVSQYV
eukprot:CAMPEP_0173239742 /NCGR_PEP_ID=MMETSP1142-20121109/13384_1 /TAXON_ID=483371 /ORGANISM="non described non described, Strain CCMP2298" /LENGTH=147 /DNA_ID=CAMNT_0014170795 /DNA_START=201 /DNA_END=640 /DNA_ORIENTATION=+